MALTAILRTAAGPAAFDETAAALDRQWSLHDEVPNNIRVQLGIAVAEVVANIVEHGSAGRHRVYIEMQMSVERSRVVVALIDDGNESFIDMNSVGMPDFSAERGRGLAMTRAALDRLTYQRRNGSNYWLLASKPF